MLNSPPPTPPYPFKLICTDFDGTLVNSDPWNRPPDSFFSAIHALKANGGAWIINTGRDWHSLRVEITARNFPIWPDWVVLIEREIHQVKKQDIIPWTQWNDTCALRHQTLFHQKSALLDRLYEHLRRSVRVSFQIHSDPGSPLAIIADNDHEADRAHAIINHLLDQDPGLSVVRNSVYFRFSHPDYHKGSCLEAIAKHLKIHPKHIFAVGDHWNDFPMLQKSIAHSIACPKNSIPEIQQSVLSQGGIVTEAIAGAGVAQALEHYQSLLQSNL